MSHQLQAGRGVPSLQAVNYQALSGLPILDSLSPLTSGLSAQSHQLVFNPQTNRLSAEPPAPPPTQNLSTSHHYENTSVGEAKSAGSRVTAESLGRNQLLEAARVWSNSAASFTSPTSLYNQFNAPLFPQSVEVSASHILASPSHLSVSSKSTQSQNVQQQHTYLQDPPPAHSSNVSHNSRLLPVTQRPHEHNLQTGASDLLYNNRPASVVSDSSGQVSRAHYTTHKAVVLGVGNSGLVQLQQDIHRQTPVQQHGGYQSLRGADIEDLSSGNIQSNIYGSYANLSSESQNFASNPSHHHQQHLASGDLSYEAVSPAPPLQHQRQHQQQESNISAHHNALSLHLGQFSDLSNLTPEHSQALADKFQIDSRVQTNHQQQLHHAEPLRSSSSIQRQQGSSTLSLKIPSQQQQQHQRIVTESNHYQGGVTVGNQSLGQILSAGRHTPASQHQTHAPSSGSLLSAPSAPSTIQAMADSTTKPKRVRSRKKKGETVPLPVVTPVASDTDNNKQPLTLSQMHEQQQLISQPPPSSNLNLNKKSNLVLSHMQQQQQHPLSQPSLSMTSPSPHISTLSMAPTNNPQQSNYARVQTPSVSQNYSNEHQQHAFQQSSLKPTNHNNGQAGFSKVQSTYKQSKKSPVKSKLNVTNLSRQQAQPTQAFPQLTTNLSQQRGSIQDGQGRVTGYNSEQQHQKQGNQIHSSSHLVSAEGSYGKLLDQNQVLIDGIGYDHLQQPDHLLDEEESSVQQQQFQMDFDNQPFMDQLASVPAPPSASGYGGEVILTQDETVRLQQSSSALVADTRPTYHGAPVDDIQPVAHYDHQQHSELKMEDVTFNIFPADDQQPPLQEQFQPAAEPEMTHTFVPHVVEDDELGHFTNPSLSEPVPMLPKGQQNQPRVLSSSEPSSAPANNSFQNSFLSYLQGHKQETLSSVSSSAVTKKPQLPKYIPEPPRPKPPPPPPTANKAAISKDSSQTSVGAENSANKRIGDLISTFSNSSLQKSGSEKEGYSVQRTSDLAVKITLPKSKSKSRFGPFAESTLLKDSMQKNRERKKKKGKFSEDLEEIHPIQRKRPPPREKTPPPARTSIGRKAKDKCIEMTKKNSKMLQLDCCICV